MKNFVKINEEYQLDKTYKAKWLDNNNYNTRIIAIGTNSECQAHLDTILNTNTINHAKKNQANKQINKNLQLDNLEQQKNFEIYLLKKDKEQINIQLLAENKTIEEKERKINQLESEIKDANQKLANRITSNIKYF